MTTTIVGFSRIGEKRELKFATEKYWRGELSADDLVATATTIKHKHWQAQKAAGVDLVTVGDFSLFDNVLDTAYRLNVVPQRYRALDLSDQDTYFALARGYAAGEQSVKALPMQKWFNTNYHYIVPEIDDDTQIQLTDAQTLAADVALAQVVQPSVKANIIGPYTFLKLARYLGQKAATDFVADIVTAYRELLAQLATTGVTWVQIDEPALVYDLSAADQALFDSLYPAIIAGPAQPKILLQTYFGDVRDTYTKLIQLPIAGIGLDLVEGQRNLGLLAEHGFPADKTLFAGVVNGKNIWRNDYAKSRATLAALPVDDNLVITTSCSLLHVPYTTAGESDLPLALQEHLAFGIQKLAELHDLDQILAGRAPAVLAANAAHFAQATHPTQVAVQERIAQLTTADYTRLPDRATRRERQKAVFQLPLLPTTTIGSFPQTSAVRQNRAAFRHQTITKSAYDAFNAAKTAEVIRWQEAAGFDVLVHGEYERNDMVEYFGEHLEGFAFTKNGWVQSYGSRAVKPPIIWGDVSRRTPMTVTSTVAAQKLTDRYVKGMLTGPVTIFNWSFPREDIAPKTSVTQIALAIRDEVRDLEANGIKIIQIDEAALREKLPLRHEDWFVEYLDWAIPAFRLLHSTVAPETQIHTHMCYSEFNAIVPAIDAMDADVISFEASRSDLSLIDDLKAARFETEVGPGVYDIHSPRVPSTDEIVAIIHRILAKLPADQVWINPDCGLKTRGESETFAALEHLIAATQIVRQEYYEKK